MRILVIFLLVLISPGLAQAATVGMEGDKLFFRAGPGEVNDVTLDAEGSTLMFRDEGAALTAGEGCQQVDEHSATCPEPVPYPRVRLGDGGDNLTVAGFDRWSIQGGPGNDTLSDPCFCVALYGGRGDDSLEGNWLEGESGNDTLRGGGSGDHIYGGWGDDQLFGADSFDRLHPGRGDDVIAGGGGSDHLVFNYAGAGVTVNLREGTARGQGKDTLAGIERVLGTISKDRMIGDANQNWLSASSGRDELFGGGGADRLYGGGWNDFLSGGRGADLLDGQRGEDTARADSSDTVYAEHILT